jgi:hypothetical protein
LFLSQDGGQVLISYDDDATPAELLWRYGFVPLLADGDAVEVEVPAAVWAAAKAKGTQAFLLRRVGTDLDGGDEQNVGTWVVPRDGWACPLVRAVRVLHMSAEEQRVALALAEREESTVGDVPIAAEAAVRAHVNELLQAHLAGYPGTLAEDEARLAAIEDQPGHAHEAMGLRLRICDRQLLHHRLSVSHLV